MNSHLYRIQESVGLPQMPKLFNTIQIILSSAQKHDMYNQYSEAVDNNHIPGPKASYSQFIKQPNLTVMVDMKCLDCHYPLRVNFAYYDEYMKAEQSPFPLDTCPECGKLQFVPLDIYNKIID